jgi:ABC-type lipoprotein export system ATPase subunit
MIEVKNLKKIFQSGDQEIVALNNLSFSFQPGQASQICGSDWPG